MISDEYTIDERASAALENLVIQNCACTRHMANNNHDYSPNINSRYRARESARRYESFENKIVTFFSKKEAGKT